jgi:hypothetical protein
MKVTEAVDHMTALYLRRIIDSFTKDFPKPEEERAREIIVQNVDELTDLERIERKLTDSSLPYSIRILEQNILEALLDQPDRMATEEAIVQHVISLEEEILGEAEAPHSLQYEDESSLETLRAVLDVAVEDDEVTRDELSLIHRLRRNLGIQERSKQILLAQLGHFPRAGNEIHTPSELSDVLADLQKQGVVFYCNRLDGGVFLIPEEIVPGVKKALGIEMSEKPWRLLLSNLTMSYLSTILQAHGLPKYPGEQRKADQIQWIIHAGIQPSEALAVLTSSELYDVLDGLAGANVSGTKAERIQRIIDYFVNLVIKDVPEEASPAENYYEYLVELAHRDRESLLANEIISKDREMDSAFEEGTRFLFEEKLGLELLSMAGSDHADGALEFTNGDLLLWDTKSKEDVYRFPRSHVRQFKRYIRDSGRRVSVFLSIVPDVAKGAESNAELLKAESGHDTDVALIAAEDLKWMAEEWNEHSSESKFNPEVFNSTGELSRGKLEQRMKLFL